MAVAGFCFQKGENLADGRFSASSEDRAVAVAEGMETVRVKQGVANEFVRIDDEPGCPPGPQGRRFCSSLAFLPGKIENGFESPKESEGIGDFSFRPKAGF